MIVNGDTLVLDAPIIGMIPTKVKEHGVSHGLGEAGYDIRIKQSVRFLPWQNQVIVFERDDPLNYIAAPGSFAIASAIEEFDMPPYLVGIVHDKSTWARRGLSMFNTVIEPGWKGFLTLELVYHGNEDLIIPAGAGIAQVIFHRTTDEANYRGKYQHQPDQPVAARSSDDHDAGQHVAQHAGLRDQRRCPECGELQQPCPSGLVCKNGHGY